MGWRIAIPDPTSRAQPRRRGAIHHAGSSARSTATPRGVASATTIPTHGTTQSSSTAPSARPIRGEVYLHRSAVPLDEADLSTEADHFQLDLWPNECERMCGV